MKTITVYGKGGIGKSLVVSNLSILYAMRGNRVLHVGCDPKADSTFSLCDSTPRKTVIDALIKEPNNIDRDKIVMQGRHGIECVEAGGPRPGLGCGGRGVARTMEIFEDLNIIDENRYDIVLFDVLGDLVCGGFAAPLKHGFGDLVVILASEETMSLYAANNIARIVIEYAENGVALAGIIVNLRDNDTDRAPLLEFARKLNTRIIGFLPRSPLALQAELDGRTLAECFPNSDIVRELKNISDCILSISDEKHELPTPVENETFNSFIRDIFRIKK